MRCLEARRELPLLIPDPVLYLEVGGARHVVAPVMELPRLRELPGVTCHAFTDYGYDELLRHGKQRRAATEVVVVRAARELGVAEAVVPYGLPLGLADRLREAGITLTVDEAEFGRRRRVKTDAQRAGIRCAQRAAEHGMDAARQLLRQAGAAGRSPAVDQVKAAMIRAFADRGCSTADFIVAHGAQSAIGHHMGSGEIQPGEPIVIDIAPYDPQSACYTDMTRTFCIGEIPRWLTEWHQLVRQSLEQARVAVTADASCRSVYDISCQVFEAHGQPTLRTSPAGPSLDHGYYHSLGHGVGLDIHEDPALGPSSSQRLLNGDVITLEPGLYQQGRGGVRLEDLILVTASGAETITDYPYSLTP